MFWYFLLPNTAKEKLQSSGAGGGDLLPGRQEDLSLQGSLEGLGDRLSQRIPVVQDLPIHKITHFVNVTHIMLHQYNSINIY